VKSALSGSCEPNKGLRFTNPSFPFPSKSFHYFFNWAEDDGSTSAAASPEEEASSTSSSSNVRSLTCQMSFHPDPRIKASSPPQLQLQYPLGLLDGTGYPEVELCSIKNLLGPVAPIRATSANSSSVKWVSQLTVQLTEIGATGP